MVTSLRDFFSERTTSKMGRLSYGYVDKTQHGSVGSIPKAMLTQYENMQPGGAHMTGGGRYQPAYPGQYDAFGGGRKYRRRTGAKSTKRSKKSRRSKRKRSGKKRA